MNDRIRIGVIGVENRSGLLIDQLPEGAEVVSVADCFLPRCEQARAKDVRAVIVGATDHARVLGYPA